MNKPNIELWDIEKVIPYDLNAKTHDKKQVEKIAKSISEFGWDQPIVVDKSGVIIKGHGRRLAAIQLDFKKVPVWIRADLTEEQVRASRLSDNRVAVSDIDADILQKELASLNYDLAGIFDKKELDFIVADLGEMKIEAFSDDLNEEVVKQTAETADRIVEADTKDIKIDKALGFKAIQGKDERYVARFMAAIEEETGKTGADAFVEFVKGLVTQTAALQG